MERLFVDIYLESSDEVGYDHAYGSSPIFSEYEDKIYRKGVLFLKFTDTVLLAII